MKLRYVLVFLSALLLAGCASHKPEINLAVESAFNPDGDYGNYKSWNFVPYKQISRLKVFEDKALRDWTEQAVVDALAERNLVRKVVDPDLLVGYQGIAEPLTEAQIEETYNQFNWDIPKDGIDPDDRWGKGTLLLFVIEAKTGKMLWRSSATAVLDESRTMDERKALVEKAVRQMLAEMPK
jgi:hypothetical protein